MRFHIVDSKIPGVKLISGKYHEDDRGVNIEIFDKEEMSREIDADFVQQNISYSHKGVLRGMHIQKVNPQGKLIRCLAGEILDYWVDLRPDSPTFKQWEVVTLSSKESKAVYLPPGLAHGFFVPCVFAMVHYSCTTRFEPLEQTGVRYDDADLKIVWPFESDFVPVISGRDANLPRLGEYLENLR